MSELGYETARWPRVEISKMESRADAQDQRADAQDQRATESETLSRSQRNLTRMLVAMVLMLGAAMICAFVVIGLLTFTNGNQKTRIDNLGTKTVQQQAQIDQLENRILQLESESR